MSVDISQYDLSQFNSESIEYMYNNNYEVINSNGTLCRYWNKVVSNSNQEQIWEYLKCLEYKQEVIRGKSVNRNNVSYGDYDGLSYRYSGTTKYAKEWTSELLWIKSLVEELTGYNYNYVLIQLYPDETSIIGEHSDDERDMVSGSCIASISFGATRKFVMINKLDRSEIEVDLYGGSLITMEGNCQKDWLHKVLKGEKGSGSRINMTFRLVNDPRNQIS